MPNLNPARLLRLLPTPACLRTAILVRNGDPATIAALNAYLDWMLND